MTFAEKLRILEEKFGEKAIATVYNNGVFEKVPYDSQVHGERATVCGYDVKRLGEMIIKYDMQKTRSNQVLKWKEGHYGFSHRCGQTFKKGDKLFDENWIISQSDDRYNTYLNLAEKAKKEEPAYYPGDAEEYVMDFVPFKQRGEKTIETEEEEFISALNFAKYVS